MTSADRALLALGAALKAASYEFVAVTPATHRRVLQRPRPSRATLRDIFGWNRPFEPSHLEPQLLALAREADVVEESVDGLRMRIRFATLGGRLFLHSGFPTVERDAVFFGPDTYRFVDFIKSELVSARSLLDLGCGSGAAGIAASVHCEQVTLTDVNAVALRYARVNAALAGTRVTVHESDVMAGVVEPVDVVVANPPYMRDTAGRAYRDGGGTHGEALTLRIARESLSRLPRGGTLLLYTGAAVVAGRDVLRDALKEICAAADATCLYRELDPDVFGEQLEEPGYHDVERIAAVALKAVRL